MTHTLSEADSRDRLAAAGVRVSPFTTVRSPAEVAEAVAGLAPPYVAKLCGEAIAHKTERGLVRLGLTDAAAVTSAVTDLLASARADDGEVTVLISTMVPGRRELIAGVFRDPQFGPTVMLGLGGVLAEAIRDVTFRLAPLTRADALDMIDSLHSQRLLGEFRGEPTLDRAGLVETLVALGQLAADDPSIVSIDANPLILVDGVPIAVDALVEVGEPPATAPTVDRGRIDLRPLFEPRGIIVTGVSNHPGKFGFVALHNILRCGFAGAVFAVGREDGEVLGRPVLASVDEVPDGAADLVFICTPTSLNEGILRSGAAKGVRAAFVAAGGYREADAEGRAAEDRLVALARELGIVLAGPNGQGVVSPPAGLCAQIVAPFPPVGRIGVASQSGNFVSAFLNLAGQSGVGISRAVSAGNAAATDVVDYLAWYADDPETAVGLTYVEGIEDGRAFFDRVAPLAARFPIVLLKGGATSGGQRAAASHTGALASDDAVFDGMCRQAGLVRAATVEEAFETAATFASQPLPRSTGRVAIVTTAGGWGVVTADAVTRARHLTLLALPEDLRAAIDEHLPPRWSRNNPIDLAGGETRDTIPTVIDLVTAHAEVDAVLVLGLGIQANQAALTKSGSFYPDHGLERIVEFHERQDRRYAEAAAAASERHAKPVLVATELAVARPDNPAVVATRDAGRLAYWSSNRAVTALDHLVGYQRWKAQR